MRGPDRLISSASTTWLKIGPRLHLELGRTLVVNRRTGYVGGEQVRRELYPLEAAAKRASQRLRQRGLADARHILDQYVALAQHRHQHKLDLVLLAHDHTGNIGLQFASEVVNSRHPLSRLGRLPIPWTGGTGWEVWTGGTGCSGDGGWPGMPGFIKCSCAHCTTDWIELLYRNNT